MRRKKNDLFGVERVPIAIPGRTNVCYGYRNGNMDVHDREG